MSVPTASRAQRRSLPPQAGPPRALFLRAELREHGRPLCRALRHRGRRGGMQRAIVFCQENFDGGLRTRTSSFSIFIISSVFDSFRQLFVQSREILFQSQRHIDTSRNLMIDICSISEYFLQDLHTFRETQTKELNRNRTIMRTV